MSSRFSEDGKAILVPGTASRRERNQMIGSPNPLLCLFHVDGNVLLLAIRELTRNLHVCLLGQFL